ncbi:hypothetical protein Tco_1122273 [Tanacetum coccineum]|uniref:RNA-directed DNA polymerase, eukaryota n=1 Tax=Tanacetum coccineum TaxID=301880 RepID=A0ABQ5J028_9ASTR
MNITMEEKRFTNNLRDNEKNLLTIRTSKLKDISPNFWTFPHLSAVCLDRHLSDHRPILLREVCIDYGATPFRLFHSWFEYQGFDAMVSNTWNSIILYDKNRMIRFKKKLQILKKDIRTWIADHKKSQTHNVQNLKSQLRDIDKALDQGVVNDDLLVTRTEKSKDGERMAKLWDLPEAIFH